jgi:hypothetical protein
MTVPIHDRIALLVDRVPKRAAAALLGAKFLDAATTWYALRHVPAAYERNPVAARFFAALGLEWGLLLLGLCTVLVLVGIVEAGTHVLRARAVASDTARRVLVSIGYVAPAVLFAATAAHNYSLLS